MVQKKKRFQLPKPPKQLLQLEDWLKTHKASEIEEAALLLGLAGLSFKTFGITEETTTEKYIWGYRDVYSVKPGTTIPYGSMQFWPMIQAGRVIPGITENLVKTREPIYSTREVKKKVYHPETALVGPIGLKLAQSANLAAGASGVITLGVLGLLGSGVVGKTIDLGAGLKLGIPTPEQLMKTITG